MPNQASIVCLCLCVRGEVTSVSALVLLCIGLCVRAREGIHIFICVYLYKYV